MPSEFTKGASFVAFAAPIGWIASEVATRSRGFGLRKEKCGFDKQAGSKRIRTFILLGTAKTGCVFSLHNHDALPYPKGIASFSPWLTAPVYPGIWNLIVFCIGTSPRHVVDCWGSTESGWRQHHWGTVGSGRGWGLGAARPNFPMAGHSAFHAI